MRGAPGGGLVGALIAAAALACDGAGAPAPVGQDRTAPAVDSVPDGPQIVNEAWRIVKMAAAHDIFTIEVEVDDPDMASDVARELIAPLEGSYAEVLVYVYRRGEGTGGPAPAKRVQWTIDGGYDELDYGRSEP